ncbi:glucose-1-phosphate thymidylyltransferase [Ferroplasma sp.]|jgi:glucose-1-phosphate thymidylyltransferase|uniref:glucose-1-phosphate thymidylyltransferase n=1 Tax=Ferroplasma sp. TaxID=2591003 RepID=UPI00260E8C30|nr:glucose-1-phosphate thymidylyltransferase [Ferroplasma sp.]
MKGIILHGGQGTRLRPLTHTGPKQLINIAGKPVSQWAIEKLKNMGIHDIAIVLGENHPEKVIKYYGDGSSLGLSITYVYQGKARGIAEAIYRCRGFIQNDDFIVYLGDNVVLEDLKDMVKKDYDASILLAKIDDPRAFGVALIENAMVVKLIEKPKEMISNLALVGVYYFKPSIFNYIGKLKPSHRAELEITEAIQSLIDNGKRIGFSIIDGWWKDTGNPSDLLEANMKFLDYFGYNSNHGVVDNSKLLGRVFLGNASTVKNSTIIGPAYIGDSVMIENSKIEPYTSIGNGTKIMNSNISFSLILENSYIENITLTETIMGDNSKAIGEGGNNKFKLVIGENSTVMKGV